MKILKLICLLSAFVLIIFPTDQLLSQIKIEVDYATFRYDQTQSLTEIYYAIPITGLTFTAKQPEGLHAQVMIRLTVNKDGNYFSDDSWKMEKTVKDSSELTESDRMVDALRYLMQPGSYQFTFYVEDLYNSDNNYTTNLEVKIDLYSKEDISLSQIELASSIKQTEMDQDHVFWKSGLEIIPNPCAIYSSKTPVLFYYLESYNLDKILTGNTYQNKTYVTATDDKIIPEIKPRVQQKKVLNSSIEVGTVNISALPSGAYHFNFEIYDINDSMRLSAFKKFYVYNPNIEPVVEGEIENIEKAVFESEFATMTEKEVDGEFEMIRYVTTNEQRNFYKKLNNVDAKRRFIYETWQKMDPTPGTTTNEYKLEYKRRIEEANQEFRSYTSKGWKTDRGRVYILYGPPTDVERFPNNPTSYAHEIWHYDNIEGGIIFVFVDLQEFGEYIQIHSTKRGEPINNNWEQTIAKNLR